MQQHFKRENREIPAASEANASERSVNVSDDTTDMYVAGKSHASVVPAKLVNKGNTPAELVEGRDAAKWNAKQAAPHRTPCRNGEFCGLSGVRDIVLASVRVCAGGRPQGRSLPR
jgi:hypothetical protein